jgi:hypothetical protein
MTLQGVLVIDVIAVALTLWVLDLVRTGRLYVGYAVMFVVAFVMIIGTVSVPPMLGAVTTLVGAAFPASALTLLALAFVGFLSIYILAQLTTLSNRLASVVQELAIRQANPSNNRTAAEPQRPDSEK